MRSTHTLVLLVAMAAGCGSTVIIASSEGTSGGAGTGGVSPRGAGGGAPDGGSDACQPTTCAALGFECGPASDSCGNLLDCGSCPSCGQVCGGGGTPGVCGPHGCAPQSCTEQGIECGPAADGCGCQLDCGPCPLGLSCFGGHCGDCEPLGAACTSNVDCCSALCSNGVCDAGGTNSCANACSAMGTTPWCSADASCPSVCQAAASAGGCTAAADAALGCIASQAQATNCWFASTCAPTLAAWGNCLGYPKGCGAVSGTGNAQSCTASLSCANATFGVHCAYADLQTDCICDIDGFPVGRCAGSGTDPCNPMQGCCADYF